jgi:hypothetical protein
MAFLFKLETTDSLPAEPATRSRPLFRPGGRETRIPLGGRRLRVVGVREDDTDEPPVLVVEDEVS